MERRLLSSVFVLLPGITERGDVIYWYLVIAGIFIPL